MLRALQSGTDDARAHVDVLSPEGLPKDAGVHQHVPAGEFFVELGTVEIDGELQLAREFIKPSAERCLPRDRVFLKKHRVLGR